MRLLPFMLVCVLLCAPAAPAPALEAHLLDVGEGQALLVRDGAKGLLIDTGHFGRAATVADALERYGVKTLEAVVLTHLDADHASNIFSLKMLHPQAVIYESGHRIAFDPCFDASRWVAEKLDSGDWQVRQLRQNDRLRWHAIDIDVLWPAQPAGNLPNPMSLVLHVRDAADSWLVMADVGLPQERQLLADGLIPADVDVLVVGHHGADDATSRELLRRTSPEYALISTDRKNLRGYPSAIVMDRLRRQGVKVHLTARQGDFNWYDGSVKIDSSVGR